MRLITCHERRKDEKDIGAPPRVLDGPASGGKGLQGHGLRGGKGSKRAPRARPHLRLAELAVPQEQLLEEEAWNIRRARIRGSQPVTSVKNKKIPGRRTCDSLNWRSWTVLDGPASGGKGSKGTASEGTA